MVVLSAQGMEVPAITKVAFTSEDRVRDVIRNFNADGFSSLYPKYKGGRPPKFTLPQRREIKKIAKSLLENPPGGRDIPGCCRAGQTRRVAEVNAGGPW
jgi:transposase